MGTFEDLTKQDITIWDDSVPLCNSLARAIQPPRKEMHWPKLALGNEYPVTNRDGKVLRYEKVKQGAEGLV